MLRLALSGSACAIYVMSLQPALPVMVNTHSVTGVMRDSLQVAKVKVSRVPCMLPSISPPTELHMCILMLCLHTCHIYIYTRMLLPAYRIWCRGTSIWCVTCFRSVTASSASFTLRPPFSSVVVKCSFEPRPGYLCVGATAAGPEGVCAVQMFCTLCAQPMSYLRCGTYIAYVLSVAPARLSASRHKSLCSLSRAQRRVQYVVAVP